MESTTPAPRTETLDLSVKLGRLQLPNPILAASGTFGYAREMASLTDIGRLGGVIPKTVTFSPRAGNATPRTVETASGLLNAIGLDNDGLTVFLQKHLPYLRTLTVPVIVNIAGEDEDQFVVMAEILDRSSENAIAGLELNISCPNVSHGLDLGIDPVRVERLTSRVRSACSLPVIVKLTPNVTDIVAIAQAASAGGADAVSLVNTFRGLAVDWRKTRPILANGVGGLSGPAIKPLALRMVWDVARACPSLPVIGIGGIQNCDDVMEFFVAGARAVQIGTTNFFQPSALVNILNDLPGAFAFLNATSLADIVGTLKSNSNTTRTRPATSSSAV